MREICNDRVNLINWGFQPTDFAYPFADADTNETDAKACGYNSARGLGNVVDPQGDCNGCVFAETHAAAGPVLPAGPGRGRLDLTLAQMENRGDQGPVTRRRLGHPHLPPHLQPHRDRGCPADLSTTPTIFNAFTTWLAGQTSKGVSVKTVQQVIGGTFKPGVLRQPAGPGRAGRQRPGRPGTDQHRPHHRVPDLLPARRLGQQHGGLGEQYDRAARIARPARPRRMSR